MRQEIGSHFWAAETGDRPFEPLADAALVLSGRTALDYIIRDIRTKREVRRACLPSYCCASMIEPFIRNGVEVAFYDVVYEDCRLRYDLGDVPSCEIGLVMQYFGFGGGDAGGAAARLRALGMTVIEDCTHSIFSRPTMRGGDYAYAALTKWTGLEAGAVVSCKNGGFTLPAPVRTNRAYLELRRKAMKAKAKRMLSPDGGKTYLEEFQAAAELLETDYADYGVGDVAAAEVNRLDAVLITAKRRDNAKSLLAGLRECGALDLIFTEVGEDDCPLCVPVLIGNGRRDRLRQHLIEHAFYLPVHWPASGLHSLTDRTRPLFDGELSVVCDQRYDASDMEALSSRIVEFLNMETGKTYA